MPLHQLALDPAAAPDLDPALITPDGAWSRGELRAATEDLTGAVASLTPAGGRIGIVSDARPEVVALLLAIPAARRVAVPINTRLTPDGMVDQLAAVGASAVIGTEEELGRLAPGLTRLSPVPTTVSLDEGAGDISLTTLAALPAVPARDGTPQPDDPAWIIATSGTTGAARGVILTGRSLCAAVATTAAARPLADDEVYLYPLPLYHVSAYNVLHALSRGRPVVLPRRFDPATIIALAAEHRVTAMSLAPTMLRMLLDHRADQDDPCSVLTDLRTIAYGAAPMDPALLKEASETLGVGFAQGYGMTELSGNAVFLSPEAHRRGLAGDERLIRAAGWPGPGVELRIADEKGVDVAAGEPGEVCIRADQVCAGYWNDRAATAGSLWGDWLRTGDVGTLDPDGLLTIVDRAKDIIVTGGENVASREVEDVISAVPDVARVAVVGLPDDRWGEAIWAVVVLRSGDDHDTAHAHAQILEHAGRHLARYKVPKGVVVVDELPVSSSGKVVKAELRRRLAEDPPTTEG